MASRDPFPMQSEEAARLAASVEGGHDIEWNTMTTKTAVSGPSDTTAGVVDYDRSSKDDEASKGLVPEEKTNNIKNNSDDKKSKGDVDVDIYQDIDYVKDDGDDDNDNDDDAFLDRPLWESRPGTSPWKRTMAVVQRGLYRIYRRLYGDDLPISEMIRTLVMASTLLFMIGGYWTLRSLKDAIVMALNGVEYIPIAKMASVGVILCVVPLYNHLLDSGMPRHHLFYLFGSTYVCLFIGIALLLMHPTIGLDNQQPSPYRVLGWLSYCGIESFGSVMVSLFWSFANSNFSLKTAKASYGVMVATGQIGSILGPTIVHHYSETWGPAKLYLLGALCMLFLQGTVYMYVSIYGAEERNVAAGGTPKKESAGILEGVHLFIKHNYVKGIFAISCLFMVEVTIVDFTMKVLAREHFAKEHPCEMGMSCYDPIDGHHGMSTDATHAVTRFLGFFGQATNGLSFIMSLFGTSAVIRFLGLRLTLLLFPSLCLFVIIMVRMHPTLYIVFLAMMLLKGFSYSLNNPTKEMLYQPTSQAVRYKAKSWIDTFGARGSKALGSIVTNAFSHSAQSLVANGSIVGICVASFLIWNARYMGSKFDEFNESGYVVGEEDVVDDGGHHNLEMGFVQNEAADTSCALDDDDDELGPEEEGQGKQEQQEGEKSGDTEDGHDETPAFAQKPKVARV